MSEALIILYFIGLIGSAIIIYLGVKTDELADYGDLAKAIGIAILPFIGFCALVFVLTIIISDAKFWNKPLKKEQK